MEHYELCWKGRSHDFSYEQVVGVLLDPIHGRRVFVIHLSRHFLQLSLKVESAACLVEADLLSLRLPSDGD